MSQDNGTYIIQTFGPEFRIGQANAIDNIYKDWDIEKDNWSPNPTVIQETFGKSKVYADLTEAFDAAGVIEDNNQTEYGVGLVTDFKTMKFTELIDESKNETDQP